MPKSGDKTAFMLALDEKRLDVMREVAQLENLRPDFNHALLQDDLRGCCDLIDRALETAHYAGDASEWALHWLVMLAAERMNYQVRARFGQDYLLALDVEPPPMMADFNQLMVERAPREMPQRIDQHGNPIDLNDYDHGS